MKDCPGVRCRQFELRDCYAEGVCAAGRPEGARILIPYSLAEPPPSVRTNVNAATLQGATLAAMATWEAVLPDVRFRFEGWVPVGGVPFDGVNSIGFGESGTGTAAGYHWREDFPNASASEWDVTLSPGAKWTWHPCTTRCSPTGGYDLELQSVLTHELGHILGLAHPSGPWTIVKDLSMFTGSAAQPAGDRSRSTLALGDMLGVRQLYPFSCPRGADGRKLGRSEVPPRYRQVCPTYIVYSP